jgi:hypothetical protein
MGGKMYPLRITQWHRNLAGESGVSAVMSTQRFGVVYGIEELLEE